MDGIHFRNGFLVAKAEKEGREGLLFLRVLQWWLERHRRGTVRLGGMEGRRMLRLWLE